MTVSQKRCILYGLLAGFVGLILVTAELASMLRRILAERFGQSVFTWVLIPVGVFLLTAVFRILREQRHSVSRLFLLAVESALFFLVVTHLRYAVEKVHYVEYGVLAWIAVLAFLLDFRPIAALLLSVLLCYVTGLLDEFRQSFSPNRVAELGDALINVYAAVFGVCAFVLVRFPQITKPRITRQDARALAAALCFALAGTFAFIEGVQGYGYLIDDGNGVAFYSSFNREALRKAGAAGLAADFFNEAERHRVQRDFYLRNRFYYARDAWYIDYGKAFRENLILERYYGRGIDSLACRWDPLVRADIEAKARCCPDAAWRSRVKGTVVTSPRPEAVRAMFAVLGFLFAGLAVYLFQRPSASPRE